jgi:hypothetical protein
MDKLEYIKNAINTISDLKSSGLFSVDVNDMNKKTAPMAPNTTKCLTCEGGYHGLPAIRSGSDGSTKDTLKPNGTIVDTVPTKRN